jgi:hypothetical protein
MKTVGNSSYGRTAMNKDKHSCTSYLDEKKTQKAIISPYFKDCELLGEIYEVQRRKKITKQNMPIQLSCAILQYAKLTMLKFYYDFLIKYVNYDDFILMYMDTDSMYMAISADKFDDIIKPELRTEYEQIKNKWFPDPNNFEYEMRTPLLFKPEFIGDGMVALCPKLYYCLGNGKNKFSSKGTQQNNNKNLLNYENFKKVLTTNIPINVENKGMRYIKDKGVMQYSLCKRGISSTYDKRNILSDNITTYPLEPNQYDEGLKNIKD